jgi:hypothetical protein
MNRDHFRAPNNVQGSRAWSRSPGVSDPSLWCRSLVATRNLVFLRSHVLSHLRSRSGILNPVDLGHATAEPLPAETKLEDALECPIRAE